MKTPGFGHSASRWFSAGLACRGVGSTLIPDGYNSAALRASEYIHVSDTSPGPAFSSPKLQSHEQPGRSGLSLGLPSIERRSGAHSKLEAANRASRPFGLRRSALPITERTKSHRGLERNEGKGPSILLCLGP
ncbi:hypothetical protein CDD83_3787 [Cordyceps sp. RAO-2017]|nr:hypothetical protein CDD83_3787 [Cordyceps sp. RAO-2017]